MKRKRHPITLLEVMIVILLIGLIGGVLSYNLKGTLDRGKKFRTEEGIKRLHEILDFQMAEGSYKPSDFVGANGSTNLHKCVTDSKLIPEGNIEKLLKDGWGEPYQFSLKDDTLEITSSHSK